MGTRKSWLQLDYRGQELRKNHFIMWWLPIAVINVMED